MKILVLLILILGSKYSYAQNGLRAEIGLGHAFQNKTTPENLDFYNTNTLSIRLGGSYQKALKQNFYFETGLFTKYNRGQKDAELVSFVSHNFRIQLPIYLGFQPLERVIFSMGLSVENNRDLNSINLFKKDHNLRLDFLTKLNYRYTENISFNFYTNWSMSNAPGIYTVNSPDNGLYLGIVYKLK